MNMEARRSARKGKTTTFGQQLLKSMEQALAHAKGEPVPVRATTVLVPKVDVRAIRERQRLSQAQFAARYGFTPASVRNWEQGRRIPDGPARILLAVIDQHPEVVESVLRLTA